MIGNETKYIKDGTDASSIDFETTGNFMAAPIDASAVGNKRTIFMLKLLPPVAEPTDEEFFNQVQKAYSALPPGDRHELDIWDATISDGLEEE